MAYTTINKPSQYFNTLTWTGNGASPRTITGVGFNPDFIWGKRRDDAAGHNLYDRVRGAGVSTNLQSNGTGAEGSGSPGTFGYLSSFETDGFGVTSGSTDNAYWNNNTATYVAWNWLANGAGVSNTAGTISSTVSANTTSGFSIVQGQMNASGSWTVGHGLGVTPSMIICRGQNVTSVWATYHKSLGAGNYLTLNTTDASTANANVWNNTSPTSSVYSMNASFWSAGAGQNFIAYCFAEVKGYSKFGSYTGNGNANGTFVYTGFKPSFFLIKNTTTAGNGWHIFDNKRIGFNTSNYQLSPNSSGAEDTTTGYTDILSNGFKMRSTNDFNNKNGDTYIYMAFAENPFVSSTLIPTTAR